MSEVPASQDSVAGFVDRPGTDSTGDCLLHSVVITYRGSSDQVTVYPRRNSCCDQMDAWLTANIDAFVQLDEMR
ncbi:hypothetical protein [Haloferax sp. DFSO52]|uniref:DUF7511 domain-containing protein n=1 Tax=Haloferax sp. DFSO52 TaxID=3388505 RepID=UPI003A843E93